MADKTIKELAEELGVTKQAIWQKIKKDSSTNLHQFMSKKGNTVYLSVDGQNIIKSMFKDKSSTNRQQKDVKVDDNSELLFLRNLIEDLQNEKKELHKLLDQQQQLTLQSNKRIEQLEAQLQIGSQSPKEEQPSAEEPKTDPDSMPDKKWWHFLRKDS
ncbi:hypothetical protein A5819_003819 [Enterococcus sp. 7E2_DIV0204]|nr:DUF536 domain-containing protein [Enterococcus sp. 7E2_DIV0204]OTN83650.1 hypothetical protein A5819_003819 [Enterococcus sp. 7E2_DIV0204]